MPRKKQETHLIGLKKEELVKTTFLMPKSIRMELKRISAEEERSMSNIVVELVRAYIVKTNR
jgi:hypothetical protein